MLNFNYSGSLTHFTLISGLSDASNITLSGLPNGWQYSLTNGDLSLDLTSSANTTPDPPTAMLIGGALAGLAGLRRRVS